MFLHALEISRLGLKKLLIVTVDTDVAVIAFYAFWDLELQLWIEWGRGTVIGCQCMLILREEIWKTVLFWYAFVGCDAVSQFLGKGKKTAWNTWGRFLETTETFIRLLCVSKLSVSNIKIKENLVVLLYDASCTHTWVNGCRKYLLSKLNHTIDQCPPTRNVQSNIYLEQCRRVIFGQRAHNW